MTPHAYGRVPEPAPGGGGHPYLFPAGARFGEDNLVLWARARRHAVTDFAGPLSIKSTKAGDVAWLVDGRPLAVDPGSFLILHDGERYSLEIDEPEPVETLCVFFRRGFVEEAARDLARPLQASLDGFAAPAPPLEFPCRLHSQPGHPLLAYLASVAALCAGPTASSAEAAA